MKFTLDKAYKFGWKGLKGWALNSEKDFPNASTALFEVTESHGKVKTTHSDRIYFVIEGKGEFIVGKSKFNVSKHDVIIIPKNTPYDYKTRTKSLTLFLVHTPAYKEECEVKLDKT